MQASIHSRKNVRLKWFDIDNIPFKIENKIEIIYSSGNVEQNLIKRTIDFQYIFNEINSEIPQSDIIIFQNDLPANYAKTNGSKGNKFLTEPQENTVVVVNDRIVEVKKGKEKITHQPPKYPDTRIKEIKIVERIDKVKRKVTFKNESNEKIDYLEVKLIETKDIRFVKSNLEPKEKDAPEYTWGMSIEPESSVSIEFELSNHVIKTYEILKPIKNENIDDIQEIQQVQQIYQQTENEFPFPEG